MDLLIDECVPASVTRVFQQQRHKIIYVVRELGQRSPDRLVAETADEQGLVLVTWNARHFRTLGLSRRPPDNQQRFRNAGMISFHCNEDQGARRASQVMASIEFEFTRALKGNDRRLLVEVYLDKLVINY